MSGGNRHRNLALAIIAAGALLAVCAVLYGIVLEHWSEKNEVYYEHQETAERQRQQTAQEIAEACEGRAGADLISCLQEQIATHDREQGTSYDLQAQQEMALWGLWVFIAAAFTAVLTTAGVYLIWQTLDATKIAADHTKGMLDEAGKTTKAAEDAVKAARDANQVAAQQFRAGFKPWISVEMKGPFLDYERRGESPTRELKDGDPPRREWVFAKTFIHCIGDIPATIEDFDLRLAEGSEWPYVENTPQHILPDAEKFFAIMPSKSAIQIHPRSGIGEDSTLAVASVVFSTDWDRQNLKMNPPPLIGKVIYSDPMGIRYEHRFAFVASPAWGDGPFKRYGGREYNGEREIE